MVKTAGPKKSKKEKHHVAHGIAHVQASFNNTKVTITDLEGNVVAWSSGGSLGFKGSRKGTPFAAQQAASTAVGNAKDCGLRSVDARVADASPPFGLSQPQVLRSSPSGM